MRWIAPLPLGSGYVDRWLSRRSPAAATVRLEQRRIYILPTRVGLAFLAALAIMLLAAINYQNSLAYALTFLLGSLFIIAILHTWRNLAGLILHSGHAQPVFAGDKASFTVRLESSGRAHHSVAVGWPGAGDALQHVDVPVDGIGEVNLPRESQCRGWLRPGRIRVESRFPLGILVAWSWVDLKLAALVYPRPLESEALERPSGADEDGSEGGSARPMGVDDYQGLRSWQPGDSTRRLDWKAFSRGRGLLIKEFAALSGTEQLLDYDVVEGSVETRLSTLCRWVLLLSEADQVFALRLPGMLIDADRGAEHRDRCLQALALHALPNEASR